MKDHDAACPTTPKSTISLAATATGQLSPPYLSAIRFPQCVDTESTWGIRVMLFVC